MPGSDDADLVARFARGEPEAVRTVHDRFAGPILTVALSILAKRDLAEEAVQTTFMKAWRGASSFDPTRELAPWLYAIARRVSIDIYRRERRPGAAVEDAGAEDLAVESLSFERTWEVWEVRRALDRLPAEEREVVRLSHLSAMTHREISEHLGVPVGTVKSRSARAHRRLSDLLGHMVEVKE